MTIHIVKIKIEDECKNKRCTECPTQPSKQKLEEESFARNYVIRFEKHISTMNALTTSAKNHQISWKIYKRKWEHMKSEICQFTPFFAMHMVTAFPEEKCEKCGYTTSFMVELTSDIALLPFQTKYRKTSLKNKKVCPTCGKLGIPHEDQRGYTRFYHYKNGKRNVCYVGKIEKAPQ